MGHINQQACPILHHSRQTGGLCGHQGQEPTSTFPTSENPEHVSPSAVLPLRTSDPDNTRSATLPAVESLADQDPTLIFYLESGRTQQKTGRVAAICQGH